jgi:uncharacterized protein
MKHGRLDVRGFILVLIFSLTIPLGAQPASAPASTRHTLWKVEGKHNVVYLLGSVHALKARHYPLAPVIEAAFTNSSIAVFEADIDALEQPETQMQLLGKARLPQGETLSQQLLPATYARFTNHLNDVGLPPEMLGQFRPAMAAITLTVLELQKLGFDPQYGLDKYFYKRTRKEGKEVVALETADFQIGLVTGFSKAEGELLMKTTLEETDKLKQEFPTLMTAWETGDADKLEELLNEASRQAPVIFKRLVADRNERWAPKIEEWARGEKNVVVIVGAAHLVGPEGVVELLRKKGLKVVQE